MSDEPRFNWRTASHAERAFFIVFVALGLTGLAACIADLAYPRNPDVHAAAETVFTMAWIVGAVVYAGKLEFDRRSRRGRS